MEEADLRSTGLCKQRRDTGSAFEDENKAARSKVRCGMPGRRVIPKNFVRVGVRMGFFRARVWRGQAVGTYRFRYLFYWRVHELEVEEEGVIHPWPRSFGRKVCG